VDSACRFVEVVVSPPAAVGVERPNRENVLVAAPVGHEAGVEAVCRPLETKDFYLQGCVGLLRLTTSRCRKDPAAALQLY
jgi:hypothetical protein